MTNFEDLYPHGVVAAVNATVPGYAESAAARTRLDTMAAPTAGSSSVISLNPNADFESNVRMQVEHRVADHLAARATAGATLNGDDLLSMTADIYVETKAALLAGNALNLARKQVRTAPTQVLDDHHDVRLAGLGRAMVELQDEVRSLSPLNEITTPTAAVASDRTRDHKQLLALDGYHSEIRREQYRILDAESNGEGWPMPLALVFRDVRKVFDLWAVWQQSGHLVHVRAPHTRDVIPPWPVPGDEGLTRGVDLEVSDRHQPVSNSKATFRVDSQRFEFLVWAVTAGAELWVPTLAELNQASRNLHEAGLPENRDDVLVDGDWVDPAQHTDPRDRERAAQRRRQAALIHP